MDQPLPNTYRFEIADSKGVTHLYTGVAHPPTEGMEILWVLMALGGEPLARLAQSVIADALQTAGESDEDIIDIDGEGNMQPSMKMSAIMDKIDLEQVDFVGAAKDLRLVIAGLPMSKLVHRLLKYGSRDGKPLSNQMNFDLAYTANYLEMLNAVGRVIAVNGFLPQFVTSMIE